MAVENTGICGESLPLRKRLRSFSTLSTGGEPPVTPPDYPLQKPQVYERISVERIYI